MEVSLLHRLSGAWLGFKGAIADHPELSTVDDLTRERWQDFLARGEWHIPTEDSNSRQCCADPLENALALLPVLLFYHEDPDYLGDRLERCAMSPEQRWVTQDLGRCLGDCLREKITLGKFEVWLDRRSRHHRPETALLKSIYDRHQSWRDFQRQLLMMTFTPAAKQLLQLYGALLWSGGNGQYSQRLLQDQPAAVQIWGEVLLGCLRGDRQSHHRHNLSLNHHELRADVLTFWSRWSGLPPTNRLRLEQLPIIANPQGLKPRSSLQLISQRHLT